MQDCLLIINVINRSYFIPNLFIYLFIYLLNFAIHTDINKWQGHHNSVHQLLWALDAYIRRNNMPMTNIVPFKKIVNKTRIKSSIFCHFEKIYRKNNNCRVAMTTTYSST